jgi:tetraacyldisaccharide 4'-kinase
MSFNFYLQKSVRFLLFPFSLPVWAYIKIRNFFYDKGWSQSTGFNLPVICVGNLSVGGTGKSPMVEMLAGIITQKYKTASLSRGYKRKTKGYVLASENTTALEIGDEPMQFHIKFPQMAVCVGESRVEAIPQLLHDRPDTQVVILDDAFQHRAIKAGLNIVLTDFNNMYYYDWYLPSGDLRDNRHSIKRAHIIVVTKCPPNLNEDKRKEILGKIEPLNWQQVYFTCIEYGVPYHILHKTNFYLYDNLEVLLLCGIANPKPLKTYIEQHTQSYAERIYNDHHIFTIDDLNDITTRLKKLTGEQNIIITTEKDAVRLLKFSDKLETIPMYVIPVQHKILFNQAASFENAILHFISNFKSSPTQAPN